MATKNKTQIINKNKISRAQSMSAALNNWAGRLKTIKSLSKEEKASILEILNTMVLTANKIAEE